MKELTIEEKAEIYNEVREKIALRFGSNVAEEIFSEFEMSKDEKIRKAILELVRQSSEILEKKNQEQMFAWLEKQGKQKPTLPKWKYKNDNTPLLRDSLILNKYGCVAKSPSGAFVNDVWVIDYDELAKLPKEELEKQGEHTDKVEPKFQNGQWIVWQNKCYKVNDNGCGYELIDQNGLSTSLEYGTVDTSARLWNITKDVKDGDVLYSLDTYQPFIYKARNIHEQATAYCGINKYGKFFVWNTNDCIITLDKYIPATKEQRDTLLKAMADAGYTFDFGKKELKKIEKKSQRMVSAEAKEALYDKPTDEEMKELLRTEYEKGRADAIVDMYVPTQISPEESLGVSSEKYMDIVDTLTQGGQKPAKWSLGDERVIAIINNALTESNTPPDDYDKVYDWLESLKQRIGG